MKILDRLDHLTALTYEALECPFVECEHPLQRLDRMTGGVLYRVASRADRWFMKRNEAR